MTRRRKHGHSFSKSGRKQTAEYRAWIGMKSRCFDRASPDYVRYGGRGITVCERWLGDDGFALFLADMGTRPTPRYSIDRKDNSGGYTPENCRWATKAEQSQNSRRARLTFADARTIRALAASGVSRDQLAERFGVAVTTIADVVRGVTWTESIP